ncbi:MAG TPA: isochorismatase family cysteine hydrolase [Pyrinomonadaceae bacterium]|jgi:nicotinamidase-related amidase
MPTKNNDLHGNAPENSPIVLLIIDVISDFDFPDGDKLLENTKPIVKNIAALRDKADKAKIPVIYINDNFGKWQSDFKKLLKHASAKTSKGHAVAKQLKPKAKDYFVLKPKHSGFYSTTLDLLLEYLNAKTLILTGLTADICVLFTANDAYLRDFKIIVPRDCVAATEAEEKEKALKYIERVLHADTRPSSEIQFGKTGIK